jgi:hypothetical protein
MKAKTKADEVDLRKVGFVNNASQYRGFFNEWQPIKEGEE